MKTLSSLFLVCFNVMRQDRFNISAQCIVSHIFLFIGNRKFVMSFCWLINRLLYFSIYVNRNENKKHFHFLLDFMISHTDGTPRQENVRRKVKMIIFIMYISIWESSICITIKRAVCFRFAQFNQISNFMIEREWMRSPRTCDTYTFAFIAIYIGLGVVVSPRHRQHELVLHCATTYSVSFSHFFFLDSLRIECNEISKTRLRSTQNTHIRRSVVTWSHTMDVASRLKCDVLNKFSIAR